MGGETLLEKSKKVTVQRRRRYLDIDIDEKIEVTKAWLRDEITLKQVSMALYNKPKAMECYPMFSCILREMYRRGDLKLKK